MQIISAPYCIEFLHPAQAEPKPKVAVQLNKKSEYQIKWEWIKRILKQVYGNDKIYNQLAERFKEPAEGGVTIKK